MKRFFTVILAVIIMTNCLFGMPVDAVLKTEKNDVISVTMTVPADALTQGDFTYVVSDGKATITSYTGSGGNVTIPSTLGGYPVTMINDSAFFQCTSLISVSIPGNVESLGYMCFYGCTNLVSVIFEGESRMALFEAYVFGNCTKLSSIILPDNLETIEERGFYNCTTLTSMLIPASVIFVGDRTFNGCSQLGNISFSSESQLEFVGDYVFNGTPWWNNSPWGSEEFFVKGHVLLKWNNIANGRLAQEGFSALPVGLTQICTDVFYRCGFLTEITIPASITAIGGYAFGYCSGLTRVSFEKGSRLSKIGQNAFRYCDNLSYIKLNTSVASIGDMAFDSCPNLNIYGYEGSYAQTYAAANSILFVTINGIWDGSIATGFESGTGTAEDPYIIETASQLAYMANSGNYVKEYVKLAYDIVLNDTSNWATWSTTPPANSWTPIGTNASSSSEFYGNFDGGGHTISGIYINTTSDYQGLFGKAFSGEICNVGIINSYIKGGNYVGSVMGSNTEGTVSNCYNTGRVSGNNKVGGLIGAGAISNCYNAGSVSGNESVGGLAGTGVVNNCYNTGSVSGNSAIGGIAGSLYLNSVNNCYSIGSVSGNSHIGGVAGSSDGYVSNCYYLSGTAPGGINGTDKVSQATALTNAQMKSRVSFVGWDFSYDWFMDEQYQYADGTTMEYPQLQVFGDFSAIPSSAIWNGSVDTEWGGSGTEENPYLISSAEELAGLSQRVKNGTGYPGVYFKLGANIILNNHEFLYWQHTAVQWIPIGNNTNKFYGNLNGDGHTVSGIYINTTDDYQGLFGSVSSSKIQNIGLINSYIKSGTYTGGIVGFMWDSSTVSNCYNSGIIYGNIRVGGIAGYIYSNSTVTDCYNSGTVYGISYVGGVAGYINSGTVRNSYNTSAVCGNTYVGGVAGCDYGTVSKCYNSGTVRGNEAIGGVTGFVYSGIMSYCYNLGEIYGNRYIGGVAGTSEGTVNNNYNAGEINGNDRVGGVAGRVGGTFGNCYNAGTVRGNTYIGGVTGETYGTVSNCYYLTGTASGGINSADVAGKAEVRTDAQMSLQTSFSGWDFNTVWEFGGMGRAYRYPNLISMRTAKVLTIKYQYADGRTAAQSVVLNLVPGETYSVTSPVIGIFSPDIAVVSGTMGQENMTVTVIYTIPGLWDGSIAAGFARGTGTEADPYIIETAPQLAFLASSTNAGTYYGGKYIQLAKNIILNDTTNWENWNTNAPVNRWIPIGFGTNHFSGKFNGNGYTVSGIYINSTDDNLGLFGYINGSFNNIVENVGVIKSYIKGDDNIGGVVGFSLSTISNCYNTGKVSGDSDVGGVAGDPMGATIINCYNTGAVSGNTYVGGLAGTLNGNVNSCYNIGAVSGTSYVGGLAGRSSDYFVRDCYNTGSVSGSSNIGGLVGVIDSGTLSNCFNTGMVSSGSSFVSGVADQVSTGFVKNCYYLAGTAAGGINGEDVPGQAEMLTNAQMKQPSSFVGWDFAYEWFLDSQYRYTSSEYPQLQAFGDFSSVPSSAVWDGSIDTVWAGSGTENDPYLITSAKELAGLAAMVNNGNTYLGEYFELATDIILNNYQPYWQHKAVQWTPIGKGGSNYFKGNINGNGHTVSGIYINSKNNYQGLFGVLLGQVNNIGVIESYIKGYNFIGGIAGTIGSSGIIKNSYNTATVNANSSVGGVGGSSSGIISNCYNVGTICGSVAGGIAGDLSSSAAVNNCYNTGIVNTNSQAGGIVGLLGTSTIISNCYNVGVVSGNKWIGGLAGDVYGTMMNCYNTGMVNGISSVGGVVGREKSTGFVSNCYNAGIINGYTSVGGVVGSNESGLIGNCYYLSAMAAGGINGADVAGQAQVLTDVLMKSRSNFVNWDFTTVWEFGGMSRGYHYPNLIALRTAKLLTIKYQYFNGSTAAESIIQNLFPGESYSAASPAIEGFKPDIAVVSGTMGDESMTVTVTYTRVIEGLWDGSIATGFASGTGTETDPYIIETAAQLAFLASSVNSGTTYSQMYIKLTRNIILNDTLHWQYWDTYTPANSWTAIGFSSTNGFYGTFNGDGHTVSGIYINTTNDYQGLFGYAEVAAIGNLGVIESLIKGGSYVGGIAGYSGSMITNCYNTGTIKGNTNVGGVAGRGNSYITNCFNTGIVIGTGDRIGGITGFGSAKDCYNTGTVSGIGSVGGIAGYLGSDIVINSYNIGTISGSSNIGGVVGYVDCGMVINCYYLSGTAAGGINGTDAVGQAEVLTDVKMKQKSNFIGWDFEYEWFMDAQYRYDSSSEYPQLQAFGDFSSISSGAVWDGSIDTAWVGSGTENTPYLITSAAELAGLAEKVNGGTSYTGEYFKLTADIVLNDTHSLYWQHGAVQWNPIGNVPNYFKGTFDGDGHTVSGIYINSPGRYKGLFGWIDSGTVKSLNVIESYIKATDSVGGVTGVVISGTVSNCSNAGKHSGRGYIGGVVGYVNSSTVDGCYNEGKISGGSVGGVVGYLSSGTVSNCYNSGIVTARSNVGGVAGSINTGTVDSCYNTGIIKGAACVGGLTGSSSGTVKNSYNTGAIAGYKYVGGSAGGSAGTVRNCYNTGVIGGNSCIGGVIGQVASGVVNYCYNIGTINGSTYVGGAVGQIYSGTVSSCYYLTGTASGGINGADVAGQAESLTDAHMQLQSSFVNWDFDTVWEFGGMSADYLYPNIIALRQLEPEPVTGVTLSDKSITLGINLTKQLTASILPATATCKNITWSSSDNTVASVSSSGLVTAIKSGTTVITVTTQDGGFTDTCTIIAINATDEANYSYTINNEKVTVTRYKGTGNSATVPSYLGGYPVTEIGSGCFANCTTLVRAYIPVSIVTIAADAFSGCSNLKFIYFSGNAPEIVSSGNRSGNRLSESPFGAGVTVYFRTGTAGWDNPAWIDKATGIVPGDINGDGRLNMNDAVSFVQRLTQGSSATYTQIEFVAADVVRDGAINMSDIVKMVQALANSSIVLY